MLAAAAFFIVALQEPATEYSTQLAGKTVKFSLAATPVGAYPGDVLEWDGWKYAEGQRAVRPVFFQLAIPSDAASRYADVRANRPETTPVWRNKVFVVTGSDVLDRDEHGVLRTRRATIEDFQRDRILQSIARFEALAEAYADGAVRVQSDVEFDVEPLRAEPDGEAFDPNVVETYLRDRINGPGFEAEDRVYRGPYSSAMLIHPVLGSGNHPGSIGVYGNPAVPDLDSLEWAMLVDWHTQMSAAATKLNVIHGNWKPMPWSLLVSGADLSPADQERLMMLPLAPPAAAVYPFPSMLASSPIASGTTLSLVQDGERGVVLQYQEHGRTVKENSMARGGGAVAPSGPNRSNFDPAATPFFTVWVKSASKDPIALAFYVGPNRVGEAILGRRDPGRVKSIPTGFVADGRWQAVTVDLRQILDMPADTLAIAPPASSLGFDKLSLGAVEYQFDDFQLSATAPTGDQGSAPANPSLDSRDEEARVRALAALDESSSKDDLEAAARLMRDPAEWVRLNAVAVFTRVKHPAAEPALIESVGSLSKRTGQMAVRALALQGTETAWAAIRRALELAPLDLARREAAIQIGKRKDPNTAGALSALMANRSRTVRLAAAEAIGGLSGDKPQLVLMAFLNQDDPRIRESVIRLADLSLPQVRRQLLYAAVNDSSDSIRAAAYLRLLDSPDPAIRAEAWKGVRDDGLYVRRALLAYLAAHPTEEARGALRIAVVDSAPSVRAGALRAFAAMPEGVRIDEVENTLSDPHPLVQIALCDLAATGKLQLPHATLATLKASKIRVIAERAARL